MAVPTVESTSSATNWFGDDITVTAPSGITDGDLLIAIGSEVDNANSITVPSGFTAITSAVGSTETKIVAGYKVASSESGSYVFPTSATTAGAGVIYRISGQASGPVINSASASSNTISSTVSKQSDSLIIYGISAWGANSTFSAHSITHGGSNPTWTEIGEASTGAGSTAGFGTAYATTTDHTDITSTTCTVAGSPTFLVAVVLSILTTQNATGTFTHLSSSPTLFAPTATSGVTGTFTHLASSPTINAPTAEGRSKTWTTTTKS